MIKIVLLLLILVLFALAAVALSRAQRRGEPATGWLRAVSGLIVLFVVVALLGCTDTINPVKYQTVEVLVTRPCFAGRTPPAIAAQLTEPVCAGSDAECVRAAKADILELQREAREFRNLFKECSK